MSEIVRLLGALWFVGIDWASEDHAVHVVDVNGRKVKRFMIRHSREGFEQLIACLSKLGPAAAIPVAIERPDGRLVDALLEAGHPVVPVSPNAIKAWRDGEVVSGAKSDAGDAEVIAEYLRMRQHKLRILAPFSDATRGLRAAVRARDALVDQRVAANNQLEACLEAFWPGAKEIFADICSGIALAFLERYPTPASAARLTEQRLAGFLSKHRYSGRRSPAELLERLRSVPAGITPGAENQARKAAVIAYAGVIRALNTAIKQLAREIATQLGEHPDHTIFTSLPRSGSINAAQMLAEWGDCREAYDTPEAVSALAGLAPVTKHSGKHHAVHFRWACNTRFRNAVTTFADNSRHSSPWAAAVYQRARDRGCDHPHAVRILARAWVRVIWRCWTDATAYDPDRHGGATRITTTKVA
jgi:transposase